MTAKPEPDFPFTIPPPPSSSTVTQAPLVKPEPRASPPPPPPPAGLKEEEDDAKPDVKGKKRERDESRGARSASPLAAAPAGWAEDPDEVARREADRQQERERREERRALGIKPKKRARKAAVKDEDDVKPKREPSLYNIYMKEKMSIPPTDDPPIPHKERFKRVADSWKFSLRNPNNVVRPWSRYGPPPIEGVEGAAGPSNVVVLSDDDEVQIVERPVSPKAEAKSEEGDLKVEAGVDGMDSEAESEVNGDAGMKKDDAPDEKPSAQTATPPAPTTPAPGSSADEPKTEPSGPTNVSDPLEPPQPPIVQEEVKPALD